MSLLLSFLPLSLTIEIRTRKKAFPTKGSSAIGSISLFLQIQSARVSLSVSSRKHTHVVYVAKRCYCCLCPRGGGGLYQIGGLQHQLAPKAAFSPGSLPKVTSRAPNALPKVRQEEISSLCSVCAYYTHKRMMPRENERERERSNKHSFTIWPGFLDVSNKVTIDHIA